MTSRKGSNSFITTCFLFLQCQVQYINYFCPLGDGDQILIYEQHEFGPGKGPHPPYKQQKSRILTNKTPRKKDTLYITHNVSSMQNKNDKGSSIQMEYNFIIEWRKLSHFLFGKSKISSSKVLISTDKHDNIHLSPSLNAITITNKPTHPNTKVV